MHKIYAGRGNLCWGSLHNRLSQLTEGHGHDVVIEAVGTPATVRAVVEEVAFTGRVVYIGYAKAPVNYETRLFVQKELEIVGSQNAEPVDFQAVIKVLEEHRFPVDQAVNLIVPFEHALSIQIDFPDNTP